ncbi:unnamed protein product [Caretta caretta]
MYPKSTFVKVRRRIFKIFFRRPPLWSVAEIQTFFLDQICEELIIHTALSEDYCNRLCVSAKVHAGSISSRQSDNNGQEEKMLQFPKMERSEDPE